MIKVSEVIRAAVSATVAKIERDHALGIKRTCTGARVRSRQSWRFNKPRAAKRPERDWTAIVFSFDAPAA